MLVEAVMVVVAIVVLEVVVVVVVIAFGCMVSGDMVPKPFK